ncbi:unnamed protein product [Ectocarpus sp. CCAP 1310/34]|nr:unnamed protein product [Ectocarpus sp. CCAP 1310/34]
MQNAAWHCGETYRRKPHLFPTTRTPHRTVPSRRSTQVAKQHKKSIALQARGHYFNVPGVPENTSTIPIPPPPRGTLENYPQKLLKHNPGMHIGTSTLN